GVRPDPVRFSRRFRIDSCAQDEEETAMPAALNAENTREIVARLSQANRQFAAAYPGEPADRQPVHTVYGGSHLFRADIAERMGKAALRSLEEHAPDP